ncbi:IS66 family insertion sequence element accessory protein TnpB [Shinella sp. S4-D37]
MSLVQSSLRQKPASGSVFAFRGRRGDRIKLLFWDGQTKPPAIARSPAAP